jgi:two-component system sensor histidine kinase KdpD
VSDARATPRGGWIRWAVWLGVLALATVALVLLRGRLDKAHIALAYLLVVLGGSAAGGRWLGIALAGLAFVCFNYLFLPPYYTLVIANPLDWLVLIAFLVTGVVAAQLLARAQERAEVARQRAREVERLAALGAETLNVGRAEDALPAVAHVIRAALGVARCEILVPERMPAPDRRDGESSPTLTVAASAGDRSSLERDASIPSVGDLAEWVLLHGAPAARFADGTSWTGDPGQPFVLPADADDAALAARHEMRTLLVPLRVRDRAVGVLRLGHDAPILLDPAARRFLDALSYYAALGVERVRLTAAAARAEAFRQADELKTALLATVSHDLRTPLTTIKALAHQLAARGEEEALSIEEEADRLNALVGDLLDLSRLSASGLPLRVELDAVDDLVATALERVRGAIGERTVRILRTDSRASEEPLLFAWFDLVQTQRALVNLVENAIKYSPADQPIELWIAHDGDHVRITVADRGSGIPEEERALVFEPFYRPRGARPDVGGAGLGLAIARRIAEAQEGSLTYAARPGGGSEFRLELRAGSAAELARIHELFIPGAR